MEIPNSSNTIDQRWEADYEGPCVQEFGPLNHEFQVIMRDDTRVECKLTTQQLKSWQVWIAVSLPSSNWQNELLSTTTMPTL